mmetsp:Transcript_7724/g.14538  ORF Transcript_7724/g.14538 Transcript_7724/m.14538 type:complete len:272 (+) Transcript_7724:1034-1849(+)
MHACALLQNQRPQQPPAHNTTHDLHVGAEARAHGVGSLPGADVRRRPRHGQIDRIRPPRGIPLPRIIRHRHHGVHLGDHRRIAQGRGVPHPRESDASDGESWARGIWNSRRCCFVSVAALAHLRTHVGVLPVQLRRAECIHQRSIHPEGPAEVPSRLLLHRSAGSADAGQQVSGETPYHAGDHGLDRALAVRYGNHVRACPQNVQRSGAGPRHEALYMVGEEKGLVADESAGSSVRSRRLPCVQKNPRGCGDPRMRGQWRGLPSQGPGRLF